MTGYRGRFAPSPTGPLHLGSAATALCAWLAARNAGGRFVLRIEDIDRPRVVPGAEQDILDDLRWLGIDWDEGPDVGGPFGPYRQSDCLAIYDEVMNLLRAKAKTYPCDCSRKELTLASAPTPNDAGVCYPGTCRELPANRGVRRPPAWRFRVGEGSVRFEDRVHGTFDDDVLSTVGDFVLQRGDGIYAYQLAVVVDDVRQGITEVVRGADLLTSTARQLLLWDSLANRRPNVAHAPLFVGAGGAKLAKRQPSMILRKYRELGVNPEKLVHALVRMLGLADDANRSLAELIPRFSWDRVLRGPVEVDGDRLLTSLL